MKEETILDVWGHASLHKLNTLPSGGKEYEFVVDGRVKGEKGYSRLRISIGHSTTNRGYLIVTKERTFGKI